MRRHGQASVRVRPIGGQSIQNRCCAVSLLHMISLFILPNNIGKTLNFSTQEISWGENLIPEYSWLSRKKVSRIKKSSNSPPLNFSPSHQHHSGYGTYPSATHQTTGHHSATSSLPRSAPGTLGWPRSSAANGASSSSLSSSSSQQQRISPNSGQGNEKQPTIRLRSFAALWVTLMFNCQPASLWDVVGLTTPYIHVRGPWGTLEHQCSEV